MLGKNITTSTNWKIYITGKYHISGNSNGVPLSDRSHRQMVLSSRQVSTTNNNKMVILLSELSLDTFKRQLKTYIFVKY